MSSENTLRTLKDLAIGHDIDALRAEAVKWIKFINNGMKTEDDLMWEKYTGQTLIYDEKTRECICVFIKHFFNLTEEELK